MRCLCCHEMARNGVLPHRRTCPEWRQGDRRQPGGHPRTVDPAHDVAHRFERFRALLGPERRRDRFDCPSCGGSGRDGKGLLVTLAGERLRFTCFTCGGGDEILSALGLTWEWVTGEVSGAGR